MDSDVNTSAAPSSFPVKVRHLALLYLLLLFVFVPLNVLLGIMLEVKDAPAYWYDLTLYFCFYGLMGSGIALMLRKSNVCTSGLLKKPSRRDWLPALLLTGASFAFTITAIYGVFVPLSYFAPEFVQFWLLDSPGLIYFTADGGIPFWGNLFGFAVVVVIAPVVEELLFRGVLLHRWAYRYGTSTAVVCSSLIFGLLHSDPIGATVFGVLMCVIYLRSGSLWVAIICHGANNFVCWRWGAGDIAYFGVDYVYTLREFRSEWPWGVIAAVITFVLLAFYRKYPFAKHAFTWPNVAAINKS